MSIDRIDRVEEEVRVKLRPQEIKFISCLFFFYLFDISLRPDFFNDQFGGEYKHHPEQDIDKRIEEYTQRFKVARVGPEQISIYEIGYGYPQ
jgi:hypothetical protein